MHLYSVLSLKVVQSVQFSIYIYFFIYLFLTKHAYFFPTCHYLDLLWCFLFFVFFLVICVCVLGKGGLLQLSHLQCLLVSWFLTETAGKTKSSSYDVHTISGLV